MSNSSTRILIIEDNDSDVVLIEAFLKEANYKHTLFKSDSLSEGLEKLWECSPEIVLLDLNLLDVSGFKTLQQFREKAPDTPVIVMTSYKNEIMGIQSVRAGAQDFLVKGTFDHRLLVKTINYSLQRFATQSKLQKKADDLSKNEERTRRALKIARFGRWEMNIVDTSMHWDDEIFRFFGFHPGSFVPSLSEYLKYVHVNDRSEVEQFFEEAMRDGKPHAINHRIVIDSKLIRHVQVNAQVSYVEKDSQMMLLGSIQDISHQPSEPANPTTQGEPDTDAETPNKPDTSDTSVEPAPGKPETSNPKVLFSDFSYNLRTPIASVINFIYLLEETSLQQQQKDYIRGIKSSLEDLSFALNNWINLSTLRTEQVNLNFTEIQVSHMLKTVLDISKIRAEKSGSELTLDVSQKLPDTIISDPQRLTQLIYNTIELAVNYTIPDAKIRLSMGVRGSRNANLHLLVRCMFQSEDFDPDEATELMKDEDIIKDHSVESSRMLQLIIAKQITSIMGGTIKLVRKTSQKFEIKVELPIDTPDKQPKSLPDKPLQQLRILLVEDHDLHRLATKRMLSNWSDKVAVDLASNGMEGVKLASQNSYDLILMDLEMPVLNGIQASIKIRGHSKTPIIALTANESKQEQERCQSIGINDYVLKPVKPERLFKSILQQVVGQS
ncbi:MAG: response regulator [Phaeodactylibacter sp.]|uniref:response regulator n=1 Tax=Phaeodactylibacter sp. TaxID=1940289 RepID=UPI0032EB7905